MSFVYGKQLIKININHIFSSSSLLKLFHSQFCKKKPHNIVYKHYNPSVRITPLMLCALIWIHKWRDLQFKVDSERQFLVRRLFNVCVRVFCAPNVTILPLQPFSQDYDLASHTTHDCSIRLPKPPLLIFILFFNSTYIHT